MAFSAPISVIRYDNGTLIKLTASTHEFISYDYDAGSHSGTFVPESITISAEYGGDISYGAWQYSSTGETFYNAENGEKGITFTQSALTLSGDSELFGNGNTSITIRLLGNDGEHADTITILRTVDPLIVYDYAYTSIQQDREKIALIASDDQLAQYRDSYTVVSKLAEVDVKADAITQTVTANYATKSYADGKASDAETAAKGYTDTELASYSTTAEMQSEIQQTANSITSTVSATYSTKTEAQGYASEAGSAAQSAAISAAAADATEKANAARSGANSDTDTKLLAYSTTTQMNSAIAQTANSITQTVSATYSTKSEAQGYASTAAGTAKSEAIAAAAQDATTKAGNAKSEAIAAAAEDATSKAGAAEQAAKSYTSEQLTNYSTTTQMNTAIEQTANSITQTVSTNYATKAELNSATDGTIIFQTPYTYSNGQTIFNAKLYQNGEDVTASFDDKYFDWYISTEAADDRVYAGTGKTFSVTVANLGYGGVITGRFLQADDDTLIDHEEEAIIQQAGYEIDVGRNMATYEVQTNLFQKDYFADKFAQIAVTEEGIISEVRNNYATTTYADTKAGDAREAAISAASSDATNKANNAITAANDYTDGLLVSYSTTEQMNTAIEQSAGRITSTVSRTYQTQTAAATDLRTAKNYADGVAGTAQSNAQGYADGKASDAITAANNYTDGLLVSYSTTEQMNTAIEQTADRITSTVSETYSTKTEAQGYAGTAESNANSHTAELLESYSTTTQMSTAIEQSASEITSTVSANYVGNNEVISKINQTAESVTISAGKININGAFSANNTFSISEAGNMSATGGSIAGWTITSNGIKKTVTIDGTSYTVTLAPPARNGKVLSITSKVNNVTKNRFYIDSTGGMYICDLNGNVIASFTASGISMMNYATNSDVQNYVGQQLSGYATTGDVTEALSGYATTGDVTEALSGYATTDDISDALSGYATTGEVTEALEGYATTGDVTEALEGYATTGDVTEALSGYATTGDVTEALEGYATTGDVTEALEGYATTGDLDGLATSDEVSTALEDYYTSDQIDNTLAGYATTDSLSSYATTSFVEGELSTKVGNNEIISKINQSAEQVSINAGKINLNGFISANNTFTIDQNGSMTATGGQIGKWNIDNCLQSSAVDRDDSNVDYIIKLVPITGASVSSNISVPVLESIRRDHGHAETLFYLSSSGQINYYGGTRLVSSYHYYGFSHYTYVEGSDSPYTDTQIDAGYIKFADENGELLMLSGDEVKCGHIELSSETPYIDWHFDKSWQDYTTRIIERSAGALTVYGTISQTSDERLKQDIAPMDAKYRGLIDKLKARTFRLKKSPEKLTAGLVAQEVLQEEEDAGIEDSVLVRGTGGEIPDPKHKGETMTDYYSVDYNALTVLLLEKVQELTNQVAALTEEVQRLKQQ